PAEILYEEIKPQIQIPSFYANNRIIGILTIIQELANNYLNGNAIWTYYSRDQLMIYSNSRELRRTDMDEVQRWILSLLKPEERPTTRALKAGFISTKLLTRYCKPIGHKYPDHICSKCNGEDNINPNVDLDMDNEIQKLKTNEDNLKSKASQQHDYKNAKLRRSKDGNNPELKGDDEKLLKTHNVCLNTAADIIIPEDIRQQEKICKIEIPSFYANKRIIGISTIIQELANNYLNGNAIWSYYARDQLMIYSNSRKLRKADMDEVQRWILPLLKPQERPTTRALKAGFILIELLTRFYKLIGHKYPDHICSKCNGEDNIILDVDLE
ncbi:hypothetical protein H5410_036726, partial [Solanum commersonii]